MMSEPIVPMPLIDAHADLVIRNARRVGMSLPIRDERDRNIRPNPWMHDA